MIDWIKSAELNGMDEDKFKTWLENYPNSHKIVIRLCDICGGSGEVIFNAYTDLCRSCAQSIRRKSPDDRKQVSDSMKHRRENNPELWDTEKYKTAQLEHHERMRSNGNPMANSDTRLKSSNSHTGNKPTIEDREKRSKSIIRYHFNKRWNNIIESLISGRSIHDFTEPVKSGKWDNDLYEWRNAVFARDKWTCQICDDKRSGIQAHHILKRSVYPASSYDVDNGITLCYDCHRETIGREESYVDFLLSKVV